MTADAVKSAATDPVVRVYAGRDWMVDDGWQFVLSFLPMRALMTRPSDEGRLVLVAAEFEFGFRRSLQRWVESREGFWKPYFRFRSDVEEIANRRAGLA